MGQGGIVWTEFPTLEVDMILRIIDKDGMFLRDDFTFDPETEIGLNVTPSQGLYHPKWDGEKWVDGMSQTEIDAIKSVASEPTTEEMLDVLFGGA